MEDKYDGNFNGSDEQEKKDFDLEAIEQKPVQFHTNEKGIKVMENGEPWFYLI